VKRTELPDVPWNGLTVLDAFCCQGGAAWGYALAGFRVVGVDKDPQPNYPFPFVQGDAVAYIREHGHLFDIGHGSPPCQRYSATQRIMRNDHPDLIGPTREAFRAAGIPFVIENVEDALPELRDPVRLCGAAFGLRTYRHRLFEAGGGLVLPQPAHARHIVLNAKMGRPWEETGRFYHAVGNFSGVEAVRRDMGVHWMTRDGIRECIPPAYTRWVGAHALRLLAAADAA
jgi:DNA (cytosine-5)-methyltransferase 1